jgi:hypothetical protein
MRFETDKSNLVIPDPTVAVERHLRVILGQHREVSIGEFLTQLGEHSPVFETGGARTAVDNMMKVNQRPADLISRSTSLALLRLERRGVVRMVASSDAPTLRLGNWPDERPVSHVVLNG